MLPIGGGRFERYVRLASPYATGNVLDIIAGALPV